MNKWTAESKFDVESTRRYSVGRDIERWKMCCKIMRCSCIPKEIWVNTVIKKMKNMSDERIDIKRWINVTTETINSLIFSWKYWCQVKSIISIWRISEVSKKRKKCFDSKALRFDSVLYDKWSRFGIMLYDKQFKNNDGFDVLLCKQVV